MLTILRISISLFGCHVKSMTRIHLLVWHFHVWLNLWGWMLLLLCYYLSCFFDIAICVPQLQPVIAASWVSRQQTDRDIWLGRVIRVYQINQIFLTLGVKSSSWDVFYKIDLFISVFIHLLGQLSDSQTAPDISFCCVFKYRQVSSWNLLWHS